MLDSLRSLFHTPRPVERSDKDQRRIDAETAGWALYCYDGCFFCSRVERAIDRLGLDIERRNILEEPRHRSELIEGGGRPTVPCLRIPGTGEGGDRFMYESVLIVEFLESRFAAPRAEEPADD